MGNLINDPEFQRTLQNIRNAFSMGGPHNAPNAAGAMESAGRGADQWGTLRGARTPPLRNPPVPVPTGNTLPVPVGQPTVTPVGMGQQAIDQAAARAAADAAAGPQATAQAATDARAAAAQQRAYNAAGRGGGSPIPPPDSGARVPGGRGLVPYDKGQTKFMDRAKYNLRGYKSWPNRPIPGTSGLLGRAASGYLAADIGANIASDVGQTFGSWNGRPIDEVAPGDTRQNIYDDIEQYGTWGVPDPIEMPLRALSQGLGFDTFNIDTLLKNKTDAQVAARGQQTPASPQGLRDFQESTTDVNEALMDRTGMPQGITGPGGRGLYIKNTYNDPANVAGRAEDQAKRDAEAAIVQQRRGDLREAVLQGKFSSAGPKTIEERRSNMEDERIQEAYYNSISGVKDQKLKAAMRKARSVEDKDIAINLQKRGTGKNIRVLDEGAATAAGMMTGKRVSDLLREGQDPWTSPDGTMVRVAAKTLLEHELSTTHGVIDSFTQLWRDRGYLNDPEITPEMFTSGDIYIDKNNNIHIANRTIKPDNPQIAQILLFLQRQAGVVE